MSKLWAIEKYLSRKEWMISQSGKVKEGDKYSMILAPDTIYIQTLYNIQNVQSD